MLSQLWQNLIFRSVLLPLVLGISIFFVIYNARYKIYNIIRNLRVGPMYGEITTWSKKPYGFEENLKKAMDFYKRGLEELVEKAIDIYSIEEGDHKLIISNVSSEIGWQNHVNPLFLEATLTMLKDIKRLCKMPRVEISKYQEWSHNKDLNLKIYGRSKKYNVIKDTEASKLRKWIMLLDKNYFYFAMQKKPDHYAAITLRQDIFQVSCQPLRTISLWYKPIDYLEYKAEQQNYVKGIRPDVLELRAKQSLKRNKKYAKMLNQFFQTFFPSTHQIDTKIKLSWKNLLTQQTMDSLNHYCKSMLERCRVSGPRDCRIVYNSLYKLKFRGVNSNPTYLYTLAEVAFRSKAYQLSQKLLNEIIILKGIDPYYIKQSERLLNVLSNSKKI